MGFDGDVNMGRRGVLASLLSIDRQGDGNALFINMRKAEFCWSFDSLKVPLGFICNRVICILLERTVVKRDINWKFPFRVQ